VKHAAPSRALAPLLLAAVLAAFAASPSRAASPADTSGAPERKMYIGLGLGFEAGNGIRLGFSRGRHGAETGIGVMYLGESGTLQYSYGARYLYTLYDGAYAWAGAGRLGHRDGSDRASMVSAGAGIGVLWRLGTMFRFMLDSGWRVYSDSDAEDGKIQVNPTFNGAVVYMW
jgi:hypothetical protein